MYLCLTRSPAVTFSLQTASFILFYHFSSNPYLCTCNKNASTHLPVVLTYHMWNTFPKFCIRWSSSGMAVCVWQNDLFKVREYYGEVFRPKIALSLKKQNENTSGCFGVGVLPQVLVRQWNIILFNWCEWNIHKFYSSLRWQDTTQLFLRLRRHNKRTCYCVSRWHLINFQ